MLLIYLAFLLLYFRPSQQHGNHVSCYYYTDGTYCTDDYSGYHVCTWKGGRHNNYAHTTVTCPSGTRCSCHYRNMCRVKQARICRPFAKSKSLIDPAIFSATGTRITTYTSPYKKNKIWSLSEEVRQDIKKGMYFRIWQPTWCKDKRFSLILPSGTNGVYSHFFGNYAKKTCRKYSSKRAPKYLGKDMAKYSLLKTYTDKHNATREKWYFKQGDFEGQYLNRFWEVSVAVDGGYVIPVKYTVSFLASEDNTHTTTRVLHFGNVTTPVNGDTSSWFNVPTFCP